MDCIDCIKGDYDPLLQAERETINQGYRRRGRLSTRDTGGEGDYQPGIQAERETIWTTGTGNSYRPGTTSRRKHWTTVVERGYQATIDRYGDGLLLLVT